MTPTKVLVVEDSPTQAAALAALLEDAGYETVVARSGERALALIAGPDGAAFDVVLSDVVMPGVSGYEVSRRIKSELGRADLPVVLVTSLTDPLDIVRGLESGADNYVTKPYDPERLLARLRAVLATASARRGGAPAARGRPVEVTFQGVSFRIGADKEQIVELLVSSYEDLVRTSEAVRAAERRARFLAEAGELLSSSLEGDVILRHLARLAVPAVADLCVVDAVEPAGAPRRVAVVHGDPARADAVAALRAAGPEVGAAALRTLRTQAMSDDAWPETADAALVRNAGAARAVVVPLVARGAALGTMLLGWSGAEHTLGKEDLALATDLARRASLAVDNARLYRDAQLATRARDDMLAIVSHDLRNPLHTVAMSASFLRELMDRAAVGPPPDGTLVGAQLDIIRRAASRANALIQDLLDVSRIEAGRLAVTLAPTDAATLIDDAVQELAPLARDRGIALEHAWHGAPALAQADRARIAQVLSNLLGNALKFTPRDGTVRVTGTNRASRVVTYEVTDTGSGIAAEHLPNLFDRFYQATRASRDGAGLGLFITRGIVEAHGGALEVESAPGVGSTFRFALPVVSSSA